MITRRAAMTGAVAFGGCATPAPLHSDRPIIELRNYLLHPGQRDTLIELFEREFVESQEALGAHVVGTFRDLDAPDHFVWLRGYADMGARLRALTDFYGGPVWRAHRLAANATMIDSDDVYLLREAGWRFVLPHDRPPLGSTLQSENLYVVDIFSATDTAAGAQDLTAVAWRDRDVIATLATEQSSNDFPALPVHDDSVFVTIRRFASVRTASAVPGLPQARRRLRLTPTARSLLR